ncbi:TPA: DUF2283 domain-containing protein [Candidatus Woesearchaeota archaeon]|nr:DUF2283 domain-containing protein [Candidatus Woesearchaeota archaeon]
MRINYDERANTMYIEFRKGTFAKNKKVDDFTIIELDEHDNILGIEILDTKLQLS